MLPQDFLALRSVFLGPRFEFFFLGGVVGAITQYNKERLDKGLVRLVKAILGDKDNTAWAFQSAIAIVLVAFVVFAVRPDFLDYLRSFKVGGFEATFAERSAATIKEADLHLEDLRDDLTVEQYESFEANFIDPNSPRGRAKRDFGPAKLVEETDAIAVLLDHGYLRPVMVAMHCLYEAHELEAASHSIELASFVYTWKNLLITTHQRGSWADAAAPDDPSTASSTAGRASAEDKRKAVIKTFLHRLWNSERAVVEYAGKMSPACVQGAPGPTQNVIGSGTLKKLDPACPEHREPLKALILSSDRDVDQDATCIDTHYQAALQILKQAHGTDAPEVVSLMVMDSYLAGAIGDLIALISGQPKDKAVFLTTMLDNFPHTDEFITPGIINIFYNVSDARIRALGSWPLQQTLSDLNYAIHGIDVYLQKAADRIEADQNATGSSGDTGSEQRSCKVPPGLYGKIYDIYLRNSLIALTTKLQLFNQIELANRSMPAASHQEWEHTLGRLLALLKGRLESAIALPEAIPARKLDQRQLEHLPQLCIDDDYILEADLAAALSIMLIQGHDVRPSARSCNMSLFLVNAADSTADTINQNQQRRLGKPQQIRWKQLVDVIAQRVANACAWTDRRATNTPRQENQADAAR
jgi:hypothetical protein